ncbi:MAG: glycoside hydrolase family 28 protein [Bryobacteraceae bacterium]
MINRRTFLAGLAAAAADPWQEAARILQGIRPPVFPERDFEITRFKPGADAGGAIRRAIEACARAGGGRVVVPAGEFVTGPIHLESNVNLHLAEGAVLRFSQDPQRYLPAVFTRWEGVECMNYSPFIYAFEKENIAVTGSGVLDGQSGREHWWPWKGRAEFGWKKGQPQQEPARQRLFEMAEKDVPVAQRKFGADAFLRPQFVEPYRCRNVLIEGITIRNSPMWEIHPVLCRNVTVRGVTVSSHGPNNDGCDPESCSGVLIENCRFDTGDDCIALKSGRNRDGRRLATPIENVIVRGCQMKDGHGGVTIGSEISGSARNIFAEDCRMDSPNLDRVLRIKTNSYRGGVIERIYMRNITVGQVADAVIHVDFNYEEGAGGPHMPTVRDIDVRGVTCNRSKYALALRGFKESPIRNVRVADCAFRNTARPDIIENVEGLQLERVTR